MTKMRSWSACFSRSTISSSSISSSASFHNSVVPISNERIPLRKDSAKELPIAITSPVAFICVPNRISAFVNLSNGNRGNFRSEEHTSELQSRENLVCRLLLEKKKKKIKQNKSIYRS